MDSHYRCAVTELKHTRIPRSHEACKESPLVDACPEQKKEEKKIQEMKKTQNTKEKKERTKSLKELITP